MRRGNQWSGSLFLLFSLDFCARILGRLCGDSFFVVVSVEDILDDILDFHVILLLRISVYSWTISVRLLIALRRKKNFFFILFIDVFSAKNL